MGAQPMRRLAGLSGYEQRKPPGTSGQFGARYHGYGSATAASGLGRFSGGDGAGMMRHGGGGMGLGMPQGGDDGMANGGSYPARSFAPPALSYKPGAMLNMQQGLGMIQPQQYAPAAQGLLSSMGGPGEDGPSNESLAVANGEEAGLGLGGNSPSGGLGGLGGGGGGAGPSVICAELHRQGFMPQAMFELDQAFGKSLARDDPRALAGYWRWAMPVVGVMRRHRWVAAAVWIVAKPWAKEMAHQMGDGAGSLIGRAMMAAGLPLCRALAPKGVGYGAA